MLLIFSLFAKTINVVIRLLNIGAGYTYPGHLALKLYPQILRDKNIQFERGVIFVTGTNGKTTTSKLIRHVLSKKGFYVVANESGANLLNGIISAILLAYKGTPFDYGVFEVDEAALIKVLTYLNPSQILFLNLSRDQLDRHWEPELILEKWRSALSMLTPLPRIIYASDQEEFSVLDFGSSNKFTSNSPVQVRGSDVYLDNSLLGTTTLTGYFNEKNLNASLVSLRNLGIEPKESISLLHDVTLAFGRGEHISISDKDLTFYLAKNPASFNNNLDFVLQKKDIDALVFVLNDNIPDGRDVSWIYDIESEKIAPVCANKKIFITGTRCFDMAVRLNYAGVSVEEMNVLPEVSTILKRVLSREGINNVVLLPNYSAMLECRKILLGRKIL